jgi:quinol monooxygenase YgiN
MMRLVVRPGRRTELLEFLRWDAEVARAQEQGTLRFDVWEVPDEPDVFYLYEAYTDPPAVEAHKQGEPYARWVARIDPDVLESRTYVVPFTQSTMSIADA